MRTDTRDRILDAARALAEENSTVQGVIVSLESVAQRAGLTKPGLMYHFPTKEALMRGLVDQAAKQWHDMLRDEAGEDSDALSAFDRYRTYIVVATTAEVSRADYWIYADALYHPSLNDAWCLWLAPWFSVDGLPVAARTLLTAARFCADGAWLSEATGIFPADDLSGVREHALELIHRAETETRTT